MKAITPGNLQRRWTIAFLPIALRDKYAQSTIALAMALIELHYNRTSGQCDPGNPLLCAELGVSESTIKRAMKELEAGGWIRRHKGVHHETTGITLHIPEGSSYDTPNQPANNASRGFTKQPQGVHETALECSRI
jgi:hypothetical protein